MNKSSGGGVIAASITPMVRYNGAPISIGSSLSKRTGFLV